MNTSVVEFYDHLAPYYHLIFADWDAAVARHGRILDRLIRRELGTERKLSVLDCSCGIGTQAIGLALQGYAVHATDISRQAVECARQAAARFGVTVAFGVADFRSLERDVADTFDVVLTCDNALPHLLTEDDLRLAARSMYGRLKAGGLLLANIRDYDKILHERPTSDPTRVFDAPSGRRITFQVWDWAPDGRTYTLGHFIVRQVNGAWETIYNQTLYRALPKAELGDILAQAGFREITWHPPETTDYHGPIVTARR